MWNKAQQAIRQFNDERDWHQYHTPANVAKSIAIEAGELLECFQWSDTQYDKEHVCQELADVVNYCIVMADALDVDLETIVLEKLQQNIEKYPVEKVKGSSKKYTEYL